MKTNFFAAFLLFFLGMSNFVNAMNISAWILDEKRKELMAKDLIRSMKAAKNFSYKWKINTCIHKKQEEEKIIFENNFYGNTNNFQKHVFDVECVKSTNIDCKHIAKLKFERLIKEIKKNYPGRLDVFIANSDKDKIMIRLYYTPKNNIGHQKAFDGPAGN